MLVYRVLLLEKDIAPVGYVRTNAGYLQTWPPST